MALPKHSQPNPAKKLTLFPRKKGDRTKQGDRSGRAGPDSDGKMMFPGGSVISDSPFDTCAGRLGRKTRAFPSVNGFRAERKEDTLSGRVIFDLRFLSRYLD